MNVAVQRLAASARDALHAHFRALPPEDRFLRFGSSLSPEGIAAYVAGIDFDRDAVFGVYDDKLALIGVTHAAFGDDLADLGLSVLPAHRGLGIGSALFARASTHARNRGVHRLFMHCLHKNAPIMRIARRFGMDIVAEAGDADAHLELPPANLASITGEFVTNRLALIDYAHKARVAAKQRVSVAGATRAARADPVLTP